MNIKNIIVVEDESDIREMMAYNLAREGYKVHSTGNGEDGLKRIKEEIPNLVLLDLMLPGMNGIEVCRKLKENPDTKQIPILMVTAKGEDDDIILGLDLGAEDYITKPFGIKVLLARVKAVLRRGTATKNETQADKRVFVKGVIINPVKHEVRVDNNRVTFTAMEFKLLHFMASNPGRVFTRDHLLTRVAGEEAYVIDRNIDVHIRSIRKKLGTYRYLIDTIRRVGYRFSDEES